MIAKLDSGHRGEVLSVAELLIIAAALEVPPVTLLYPNLPDGEVERTPGKVETALSAVRWFAGEDDTGSPEYLPRLLHLSREREGMIRSAKRQEQTLARMAARGEPIDGKSWPRIDYVSHIRQIERMMREIPGATFDEFEFNFPLSYPRGHA
ncbi:hypothetical protein MLIT_46080 [Mycolicibacterium litorale]|uniref:Uncharacterized protein n=1 Tax=Mycolicibacterium litorale TaxID=758802 RepID=A0AAD1IQF8_9MYCO|nr:hypothetical protein MLIT_46080 [Mycolicibacterium litorale]